MVIDWGVLVRTGREHLAFKLCDSARVTWVLDNVFVATAPSFCNTPRSLGDVHYSLLSFRRKKCINPGEQPWSPDPFGSCWYHCCNTGGPELSSFPTAGPPVGSQAHSSADTWRLGRCLLTLDSSPRPLPPCGHFLQPVRPEHFAHVGPVQSGSLLPGPQLQVGRTQLHVSTWVGHTLGWFGPEGFLGVGHPLCLERLLASLSICRPPRAELPSHSFTLKTHSHRLP